MVHFSGFYAWLKEPLSLRAQEDARQTDLIQQAWTDSGKVYGYRNCTMTFLMLVRPVQRTVLHVWPAWLVSQRRLATSAAQVDMVANLQW